MRRGPGILRGYQQPAKETLTRPFDCLCVCHPVMQRPKAWKDQRCQTCWEDGGKPWAEFLESALACIPRV